VRALAAAGLISVALAAAAPGAAGQAGVSYQIPPDNPFVNVPGARGEVFAYGMRNPYRWSFDRQTGDMVVGDVGGIMEEITFLPRTASSGANLGWNCLSGSAVQSGCTPPNHTGPSYEYMSSADVVIGGYVVRDPTLPSFSGRYLFGQFNGALNTLGPGASGSPVDAGVDVPAVAGFGEDGVGRLYVVSLSGPVARLTQAGPGVLAAAPVGNFTQPVAVAAAPGDSERLFIVEKPGRVQLRTGTSVSEFLDIRALVGDSGYEEGLLAVAVSPDYATNGRVYAFYTDNGGDLQVDEYTRTASGPDRSGPGTRRSILTIPHRQASNHNGGQLLFGPDGYLYLSTGDGGTQEDPEGDAQNRGSLLGKIIRIDVDAAPGPPQPLPDSTAPTLRTRVKRRQRVLRLRGAVAYVRCSEACSVRASGRLRVGRRWFAMRPAAAAAQARPRKRLKVRLTRRGRRVLKRALRRDRRATVRLTLLATDPAGNRSPRARRTVHVRR
jgi:glucose/arabinose dehydrogenase